MPFPRKRIALQFSEEERRKLDSIRGSRVEEKLSVAPSEGAIMAAPEGARAPWVDGSDGARSL